MKPKRITDEQIKRTAKAMHSYLQRRDPAAVSRGGWKDMLKKVRGYWMLLARYVENRVARQRREIFNGRRAAIARAKNAAAIAARRKGGK